MWCRLCRPEVRIRRQVHEKIRQILNLLKTSKVRTLSNSNANFITSLVRSLYLNVKVAAALLRKLCNSCGMMCGNQTDNGNHKSDFFDEIGAGTLQIVLK